MNRKRIGLLATLLVAIAVAVPTAAFGGGAHSASTHTVTLREFRFHPGKLTIKKGESVKWVWRDNVEHNVTSHSFHSRTQESGSYTVRFTKKGTFSYRCTIHEEEGMKGKIVVH